MFTARPFSVYSTSARLSLFTKALKDKHAGRRRQKTRRASIPPKTALPSSAIPPQGRSPTRRGVPGFKTSSPGDTPQRVDARRCCGGPHARTAITDEGQVRRRCGRAAGAPTQPSKTDMKEPQTKTTKTDLRNCGKRIISKSGSLKQTNVINVRCHPA